MAIEAKPWRPLACLVIAALLFAGCSGKTQNAGSPYVPPPSDHFLYRDHQVSIKAGATFEQPFHLMQGQVQFSYQDTGSGSENVCLIKASDATAWSNGQTVFGWGCQNGVSSTTDQESPGPGDYDLAFKCMNSFQNCNLKYTISEYY